MDHGLEVFRFGEALEQFASGDTAAAPVQWIGPLIRPA
jgi:hypothetical protein